MRSFAIATAMAAAMTFGAVWKAGDAPADATTAISTTKLMFVVAPSTSCQATPNSDARSVSTLALGDQLNVTRSENAWSRIEFASGLACWTKAEALSDERPKVGARPHARAPAVPEYTMPDQAMDAPIPQAVVGTAVYFPNCRSAWAVGAAPMYRGDPGYRPQLDGDSDGVACEPFRRR